MLNDEVYHLVLVSNKSIILSRYGDIQDGGQAKRRNHRFKTRSFVPFARRILARQTLNYIRRTRPPTVSAAKNELVLARQPRHRFLLIYIDGDTYSHRFLRTSFSSRRRRRRRRKREGEANQQPYSRKLTFSLIDVRLLLAFA